MQSKYLARFTRLEKGMLPLRGNRLVVEVLPKEELRSKGGLIIGSDVKYKGSAQDFQPTLAVVLATGPGYFDDETGADIEMDVVPGNLILVSDMGLKYYSQFPGLDEYTSNTIAITRDSEIHAMWNSIEAYLAYAAVLNG